MIPAEALQKVLRTPNDASRAEFGLAIFYLAERLAVVERTLADRNRVFTPPTPEEVTAYARSIGFELDGQAFCDYYEARNWQLGKVKMKSFKAAVRTWKNRRTQEQGLQRPARLPDNLRPEHE